MPFISNSFLLKKETKVNTNKSEFLQFRFMSNKINDPRNTGRLAGLQVPALFIYKIYWCAISIKY